MRTRGAAERKYERAWSRAASVIDRRIAEGQSDPAEIVASVSTGLSERFLARREFWDYYTKLGIRTAADGRPGERVVVREGAYRVVPFHAERDTTIVRTLLGFLASRPGQIDCVVELGSGLGGNLLALDQAARGRFAVPIELHACELTENGRRITETLRGLDPEINLSIHHFDYYEPDLSFLERNPNVLFFTAHSIEQIPNLGRAVLEEMLERAGRCFCFHFEPVGWQLDAGLLERRRRHDRSPGRLLAALDNRLHRVARKVDVAFGTRLDRGFPGIDLVPYDIGKPDRVARNAAAWSARLGYNKNLVSLLRAFEAEAKITLKHEAINAFGENPFNPTSILQWVKSPSA